MKEHSISFDQASHDTSIVDKYLDTSIVKTGKKFYKTTFPSGMISTKDNESTSDYQV